MNRDDAEGANAALRRSVSYRAAVTAGRHVSPAGATSRRRDRSCRRCPVPDQANDQRSIQRSPSRSQFEAIWSDVATFSDVAKT